MKAYEKLLVFMGLIEKEGFAVEYKEDHGIFMAYIQIYGNAFRLKVTHPLYMDYVIMENASVADAGDVLGLRQQALANEFKSKAPRLRPWESDFNPVKQAEIYLQAFNRMRDIYPAIAAAEKEYLPEFRRIKVLALNSAFKP